MNNKEVRIGNLIKRNGLAIKVDEAILLQINKNPEEFESIEMTYSLLKSLLYEYYGEEKKTKEEDEEDWIGFTNTLIIKTYSANEIDFNAIEKQIRVSFYKNTTDFREELTGITLFKQTSSNHIEEFKLWDYKRDFLLNKTCPRNFYLHDLQNIFYLVSGGRELEFSEEQIRELIRIELSKNENSIEE